MSKVRVTKTVKDVNGPFNGVVKTTKITTQGDGPGKRYLNDEQTEQWARFAEKNKNLSFDQKWDAFSKLNPKFGATKEDVSKALFNYRRYLTDKENAKIAAEGGVGVGAKAERGAQNIGTIDTNDTFLQITDEKGNIVGRDTETGQLSSLYKRQPDPETQYLNKIFVQGNKIPSPSLVNLDIPKIDYRRQIGIFELSGGGQFAAPIEQLEKIPEYNSSLQKLYREQMSNIPQSSPSLLNK